MSLFFSANSVSTAPLRWDLSVIRSRVKARCHRASHGQHARYKRMGHTKGHEALSQIKSALLEWLQCSVLDEVWD
jgi:hypothetical protein